MTHRKLQRVDQQVRRVQTHVDRLRAWKENYEQLRDEYQ